MTEAMSKEALSDLRGRVLRKEQPSMEELRLAVHTLREGRFAAAASKTAKAKKASDKKAPVNLKAIFDMPDEAE